jgi:hypothetical protein
MVQAQGQADRWFGELHWSVIKGRLTLERKLNLPSSRATVPGAQKVSSRSSYSFTILDAIYDNTRAMLKGKTVPRQTKCQADNTQTSATTPRLVIAFKALRDIASSRTDAFERAGIHCNRERYLSFGRRRAGWRRLNDDSLKGESGGMKQAGLA